MDAEVIVVDNNSIDASIPYLQPLFPGIRFISNAENLGFAKANNQALALSSGEYVLFLNPDTLVPEDSLHVCLAFIKEHPKAGALGVRMLDGKGRFLAESKRAFPTPIVSLYKLVGLAALFPRSGVFNKYALGDLDEQQNHEVEVLAGAFMLVNKKLLDELHGFDESYFMYGEDIDLSFRIKQAGRQNHYFAGTSIIHFKGESSRRGSLAYVRFFYSAMLIFVQRHYRAKWFAYFIRFAITCRAIIAVLDRIARPIILPVSDGVIVGLSLKAVSLFWVSQIRQGKDFGVPFMVYALPLFSVIFIASAAFIGLYDRAYKTSKTILAVAFAAVSMLAVYSLLPESIRFSRGVILWGGILGGMGIYLSRRLLATGKNNLFSNETELTGQTVVVATEKEYAEIVALLEKAVPGEMLLGRIATHSSENTALCSLADLATLEKRIRLREIIFCEGTLSLTEIIAQVQRFAKTGTQVLIHMNGSHSMVGSDTNAAISKIIAPFTGYRIAEPHQKRMKRMMDLLLSFFFILTAPVHLLLHRKGSALIDNAFGVLAANRTWVGYASASASLPGIKKGVITHMGSANSFSERLVEKADNLYAKNYDWWQDAIIVFQHYQRLG